MTEDDDPSVHAAWRRLEILYAQEPLPLVVDGPASPQEIARCEGRLGLAFPEDLRTSYLLHRGGDLPDGFHMLEPDVVAETWVGLQELEDELGAFGTDEVVEDSEDEQRIKSAVYHAGWIPLALKDSTHLFVDCAPGPRGRVGQVIVEYTEIDHLVLADSMTDLLLYLGDLMEARTTVHDDRFGFFVTDRHGLRERLRAEATWLRASATTDRLGLLQRVVSFDVAGVHDWIRRRRNLDEQDRSGWTALLHAVCGQHWDLCRALIDAGADVDRAAPEWSPLMAAAYYGGTETVQELLLAGAGPDVPDERGNTALHRAAEGGQAKIVALLLGAGATVDLRDRTEPDTALILAARSGRVDIVRTLLAHGADIDAVGREGATALMQTAGRFDAGPSLVEVVEVLLAAGAATGTRNWAGTAVEHARRRGNRAVVELLE